VSRTAGCGNWGRWPALLGVAALGIALFWWTPQADGSSPASSAAAQRQGAANHVFVWATTGGGRRLGRPHRAAVRIRWRGKVIGRAKTGVRGIAVVKLKRAPRRFSVEVSNGVFRGHRPKRVSGTLRARVSNYRGGPVYVNPATTLVHYYASLHPKLPLRKARNRVAAFLRLPRGHDLEAAMVSSASFNGRRYLRRARRAGGLDAYSRGLARRIDRRRRGGQARVSAAESPETLGALASLSQSISNYSGLFRAISGVSGALGIVNTALSLAGATPLDNEVDELANEMGQLLQEMQVIENDLEAIHSQVSKLSQQDAEGTYSILAKQQSELIGQIEEAQTRWTAIANLGAQISCPSGTANCPEAEPVQQVCAASPASADCVKLETMYTGLGGFVEFMANAGLTDYSKARGFADAIGDQGLIKYASLSTAAGERFYDSEKSALAVAGADYYLAQLSLLISLIGTYQTAPTVAIPVVNIELGLAGLTEDTRTLPAQVPRVMPSTNLIDTNTGLMWQTQIAANTVLSGAAIPLLPTFYMLGLKSVHGATPWQMAGAGTFHYNDGWISHDGSLKVPRTLGENAPAKLGSRIWKPAPQKALEGLLAESSYDDLVAAGFSPDLFTVIREKALGGLVYNALFVATLPGNGAPSEFDSKDAALYGGLFNFRDSKPSPDLGMVEIGELDDTSLNYLMERTPYGSECWYYAQPGKPPSC